VPVFLNAAITTLAPPLRRCARCSHLAVPISIAPLLLGAQLTVFVRPPVTFTITLIRQREFAYTVSPESASTSALVNVHGAALSIVTVLDKSACVNCSVSLDCGRYVDRALEKLCHWRVGLRHLTTTTQADVAPDTRLVLVEVQAELAALMIGNRPFEYRARDTNLYPVATVSSADSPSQCERAPPPSQHRTGVPPARQCSRAP
jgi:hypothetical protein